MDSDLEKLGFTGIRVETLTEANPQTGKIGLNTEHDGGLKKAKEVYNTKKEDFSSSRKLVEEGIKNTKKGEQIIFSRFVDGSRVQFRACGKSGHPKVEIKDIAKNIEEKITFK